ncbi:hypothetical protein Q4524_14180 [Alteromonas stellipolaris]|uniref:Uncharacterized protein n=1 Tax=Alteromonas stellipolaris TaxID=233316 RepID=A0AAW7Z6D5_9ALTE|nr:hypothetical protein [Alteromonas stellipolaris]MDO6539734.1 hypothetical protein [Alteromonas stellipolaris]MDO6579410.1 hypothetical protein [Alteromonas stellipolaris]
MKILAVKAKPYVSCRFAGLKSTLPGSVLQLKYRLKNSFVAQPADSVFYLESM